jgi:hypothetical protein
MSTGAVIVHKQPAMRIAVPYGANTINLLWSIESAHYFKVHGRGWEKTTDPSPHLTPFSGRAKRPRATLSVRRIQQQQKEPY